MKTSKRKRSPKSAPVVEALDVASAPAVAESAPVVAMEVVAEPANEPIVAEAAAAPVVAADAANSAVAEAVASDEDIAAKAVVTDEVVVPETVAAESVVAEANASEAVAELGPNDETVAVEAVAADEPAVAASVDPVVVLAANCSVKDAAALKTSLCAVANESAAVTLDASAVERVDTATMQLLCAFVRDRSARNQSIVWRGQSQALHDAVRLLGVGALLGFDAAQGVAA